MAKAIADHRLFDALQAAGLADADTRRVVIDIRVGEIPVVYTERYGDPGDLLHVAAGAAGVEIRKEG